jgi:hypothetical protein
MAAAFPARTRPGKVHLIRIDAVEPTIIKLDDQQLGRIAADRAKVLAACRTEPLLQAEAARSLAALARKAGCWHTQAAAICPDRSRESSPPAQQGGWAPPQIPVTGPRKVHARCTGGAWKVNARSWPRKEVAMPARAAICRPRLRP